MLAANDPHFLLGNSHWSVVLLPYFVSISAGVLGMLDGILTCFYATILISYLVLLGKSLEEVR